MSKPYSESCDQNRDAILAVIRPLLAQSHAVLEIGSGTGQHAVYFARQMPHLSWHTSDLAAHHEGIRMWLEEAGLENVVPPLTLDVTQSEWPALEVDAIFTANSFHIMSWEAVVATYAGAGELLHTGGLFLAYGPFNYANRYTSESNARFDAWLKQRDPASGVRNFEDVDALARQAGMSLQQDYAMPANNRILCWQKM